MSDTLYDRAGIIVTGYAGATSDGPDRRRWQIITLESFATLDRSDVEALVTALLADLGDRA